MQFWQLAESRRSCLEFESTPIPRAALERCLLAAHWAVDPGRSQPWRLVILWGEKPRARLAEALGVAPAHSAAVLLAVWCRPHAGDVPTPTELLAVGAATANLVLAAWEQGVGSLWLPEALLGRPDVTRACLGLEGEHLLGVLAMGYPAAVPPRPPRVPLEQCVRWAP